MSPASLQLERREEEEQLDALQMEEEDEEVVREESRPLGSSRDDGIHSHVSRSENLE